MKRRRPVKKSNPPPSTTEKETPSKPNDNRPESGDEVARVILTPLQRDKEDEDITITDEVPSTSSRSRRRVDGRGDSEKPNNLRAKRDCTKEKKRYRIDSSSDTDKRSSSPEVILSERERSASESSSSSSDFPSKAKKPKKYYEPVKSKKGKTNESLERRKFNLEVERLDFEKSKWAFEKGFMKKQFKLDERRLELESENRKYEIDTKYKTELEIAKLRNK